MYERISKALLGAAALLCGAAGCSCYRNMVDVSYPERYECQDREYVTSALAMQAQNGHVLDQTVWNAYFDPGTDHLTLAGIKQLTGLGRRRPMPDTVVYLQTANDIEVDPAKPEVMARTRIELDLARKQAVERFMVAQTGLDFEVVMPHNPHVPSLYGGEAVSIIHDISTTAKGTMAATGGASTTGGGGTGSPTGGGTPGGGK